MWLLSIKRPLVVPILETKAPRTPSFSLMLLTFWLSRFPKQKLNLCGSFPTPSFSFSSDKWNRNIHSDPLTGR